MFANKTYYIFIVTRHKLISTFIQHFYILLFIHNFVKILNCFKYFLIVNIYRVFFIPHYKIKSNYYRSEINYMNINAYLIILVVERSLKNA